jgi:hypothetical protein
MVRIGGIEVKGCRMNEKQPPVMDISKRYRRR